jgi:hypothetical protein
MPLPFPGVVTNRNKGRWVVMGRQSLQSCRAGLVGHTCCHGSGHKEEGLCSSAPHSKGQALEPEQSQREDICFDDSWVAGEGLGPEEGRGPGACFSLPGPALSTAHCLSLPWLSPLV